MTAQREQDALLDLMFVDNKSYRITSGRGLTDAEHVLEVLACVEAVHESNISEVESMVNAVSHECSALICVLLDTDAPRLSLINTLSTLNIPVKFILVSANDEDSNAFIAPDQHIDVIYHKSLQADLDKLWTV